MKNIMKRTAVISLVAIIGFLFATLSLTGCDNGSTGGSGTKRLSDARFNGIFAGTRDYSGSGVHYDNKLTFDGTNKIQYYSQTTKNGVKETPYEFTFEMEAIGGKFHRRLWENPYDDWTEWLNYEFTQGGNRLIIQWFDFYTTPDSYDVYNKISFRTVLNETSTERTVLDLSDEEMYNLMKQMEAKHRLEYENK